MFYLAALPRLFGYSKGPYTSKGGERVMIYEFDLEIKE